MKTNKQASYSAIGKLLLLLFLRKDVLIILFILLSIPAAIATIFSLSSKIIIEETNYMYEHMLPIEQLLIYPAHRNTSMNKGCTYINASYARIVYGNYSLTNMIVLIDMKTYMENTKYWPKKPIIHMNKSILLSFPSTIQKTLRGIKPGSHIIICINSSCKTFTADLIHYGRGFIGSSVIIITNNTENRLFPIYKTYSICRVNKSSIPNIMNSLDSPILSNSNFLTALISLVYFPIMLSGIKIIKKTFSSEAEILYEIGVSKNKITCLTLIILLLIGLFMELYGVFFATLIMHLSLWILGFYGFIIVSRPIPSTYTLLNTITILAMLFITGILITFKEQEGG